MDPDATRSGLPAPKIRVYFIPLAVPNFVSSKIIQMPQRLPAIQMENALVREIRCFLRIIGRAISRNISLEIIVITSQEICVPAFPGTVPPFSGLDVTTLVLLRSSE